MGRSSKEEAARTRSRIVEKASELFRAAGVDQVSIADIVGALGLTKGGFYKHFLSKDALVAEAFGLAFREASTTWRAVRDHSPTKAAHALAHHYLPPEGSSERCPMIAFAPHIAGGHGADESCKAFETGTLELLEQFGADSFSSDSPRLDSDTLVLFAAMVGARVLGEAGGQVPVIRAIQEAVLNAADHSAQAD